MNKTVTFNLNGLVFTIEEDGYALLKQYLDTVKAYFGRQADGLEIVSEIEARIAEKFRLALDAAGRQVLYAADVNQLITEMGTVDDFEAFEADDETQNNNYESTYTASSRPKRFYRTSHSRILAGVANGLAVYLKADVSLVRLLFILSTIFLAGFGLILYLVLWIATPESDEVVAPRPTSNDKGRKNTRLYRDAEDKVLGGVSAGLAAYLSIDPLAVRILFIIATFWGGFGILSYLLLWIVMPAARSLSQKIEMRGQEANLANMKDARQPKGEVRPKTGLNRLLALPVDIIRFFAHLIKKIVTSFSGLLRVFGGGFLIFFSAVILFSMIAVLSVMIAYFTGYLSTTEIPFPLETISGSVVSDIIISILLFLLIIIPVLYLLYLGVRLLLNRKLFRRPVLVIGAWSWLAVVVLCLVMATRTALEFQSEGSITLDQKIVLGQNEMLEFRPEADNEQEHYDWVKIEWRISEIDSVVTLKKRQLARGSSVEVARQNAMMIDYVIVKTDTLVELARGINFKPGARFRAQQVELEIYIPKNRPVRIDNRYYSDSEIINYHNLEFSTIETFILTDEGLACLSCKPRSTNTEEADEALAPLPTAPDAPATL